MTYIQSENVADNLKPSDWPMPVNMKMEKKKTRELLINLTLIEQLAIIMKNLKDSAHALRRVY